MAITFSLSPNPRWVVIDNFSKLPVGAVIYTFSSENPSVPKTAYQDAGGTIPYGEYVQGFANGTFPPIFWRFDSDFPSDLYYIEVWDQVKSVGNDAVMLWNFRGLSGGGSGGGGVITTNLDLENLVINGQFFNNVGNQPVAPSTSVDTLVKLAPSNHDGFVGTGTISTGPVGPDIIFAKQNQTETDSISFIDFAQGDNFFVDTPTPKQFVRYSSNNLGSSNYKFVQFPIVKGLQNLNNQDISVQLWNKWNSGSTNIGLYLRQFFGNGGGASGDFDTFLTQLNLPDDKWNLTKINSIAIPTIAGKVLGTCGNDALYLQLRFPASELVNLDFILPAMYLGDTTSTTDFHTQDYVDSIANTPRTGDTRTSINAFLPYGWVKMDDGTIGNLASNATNRKNLDTFPLFDLLWNTFLANQTFAPMRNSAGTIVNYGTSSVSDFTANNQLTLTRALGRVFAGTIPVQTVLSFTTPAPNIITVSSTLNFREFGPVAVTGSSNTSALPNKTYYIKIPSGTTIILFPTEEDAVLNTNQVTFVSGITGTISFPAHPLGQFVGQETHIQTISEMPSHDHNLASGQSFVTSVGSSFGVGTSGTSFDGVTVTNTRGGGQPFNILQPTTYMNVFMKL